jgi:uncharacterized protein (TIGR02996 family)
MSHLLDDLHRAVIADPNDCTVRLVYADALEESGKPEDTARAEFVRCQIAAATRGDAAAAEMARARELFDRHWLDWWRPVCEKANLPLPHVPGKRRRDAVTPGTRRTRRCRHWPYTCSAEDTSILAAPFGMTVRYARGFPEEVLFANIAEPEQPSRLTHEWGDAMPLVRLAFKTTVTLREWGRIDGPHLGRLAELTFDQLTAETAAHAAKSPNLGRLLKLSVFPVGASLAALRSLVSAPTWKGLRLLRITGPLSPEQLRDFAQRMRLKKLEELELTLGNPMDPLGVLGGVMALISQAVRTVIRGIAIPTISGPRWPEYGPALEALAAAPWTRRIRVLRLSTGAFPNDLAGVMAALAGESGQAHRQIPDSAVIALANALDHERLRRLVISSLVISPKAREHLKVRLGSRVEME